MSCFFLFIKTFFDYPFLINLHITKNIFLIIFVLSKKILLLPRKLIINTI